MRHIPKSKIRSPAYANFARINDIAYVVSAKKSGLTKVGILQTHMDFGRPPRYCDIHFVLHDLEEPYIGLLAALPLFDGHGFASKLFP